MIHIKQDVLKWAVCRHYNITSEELHQDIRRADIIGARRMFYYIARNHLKITYKKIGSIFNQDHATVMYHERKLSDFLEFDKTEIGIYDAIKEQMFGAIEYDTAQDELKDLQRKKLLIEDRVEELQEQIKNQYNFLFN